MLYHRLLSLLAPDSCRRSSMLQISTRFARLIILVACHTLLIRPAFAEEEQQHEKQFSVYSVVAHNDKQLDYLMWLWHGGQLPHTSNSTDESDSDDNSTETGDFGAGRVDFWQPPAGLKRQAHVMAGGGDRDTLVRVLTLRGMRPEVLVPDVGRVLRERQREHERRLKRLQLLQRGDSVNGEIRRRDDTGAPFFNLAAWHTYDEISDYMRRLAARYPSFCRVLTIGHTHEGRPIHVMHIGSAARSSARKPAMWIDGGIHAREWVAPSTAVYFISRLATTYESNRETRELVDEIDWYIAPVLNPDGYAYSMSRPDQVEVRLWRKNRAPAKCQRDRWAGVQCCLGVDLNRNYDFHWGKVGSSTDPCSEIYQGVEPFSEPETRAVKNFVERNHARIDAFITMHSYSQIWMYPYGHQHSTYPADVADLRRVALRARDALQSLYGTKYTVGTGADTLYPASGGAEDWAKAAAGVKYAYLLELRPEEHVYEGFMINEAYIVPTGRETWHGVKVVAKQVLQEFGPPKPPPTNRIVGTPVSSALTGASCSDTDQFCPVWSAHGACDAWPVMKTKCPASCKICPRPFSTCTDKWVECGRWAEANLCASVSAQCRRSCGQC